MPTAAASAPITAVGLSGTPYTLSIVRRLAAGAAVAVGTDPAATYTLTRVEPSVALPLSALHAEAATWAAAAAAAPAAAGEEGAEPAAERRGDRRERPQHRRECRRDAGGEELPEAQRQAAAAAGRRR